MALMRFDPFRDADRFTQQLFGEARRTTMMSMDAYRRGDTFVVHFDIPGVDPDAVDLSVDQNVLTVKAERSWSASEDDDVLVTERPQGTFSRQLFLGDTLDTERINANCSNGVLTLTIPVAEQAKPRRIAITSDEKPKPSRRSR
jgi:HSP20 family protein